VEVGGELTAIHIAYFPKLPHYSLIVSFAKHSYCGSRIKHSSKLCTVASIRTPVLNGRNYYGLTLWEALPTSMGYRMAPNEYSVVSVFLSCDF